MVVLSHLRIVLEAVSRASDLAQTRCLKASISSTRLSSSNVTSFLELYSAVSRTQSERSLFLNLPDASVVEGYKPVTDD